MSSHPIVATRPGAASPNPAPRRDDWAAPAPVVEAADRLAMAARELSDSLVPALARVAAEFSQAQGWHLFGYARASDYARERHGRSARWLRGLASLGRALEEFPPLEAALTGADGDSPIGQTAAIGIAPVARSDTLAAWIQRARQVPIRQLEQDLRQAHRDAKQLHAQEPEFDFSGPQRFRYSGRDGLFPDGLRSPRARDGFEEPDDLSPDGLRRPLARDSSQDPDAPCIFKGRLPGPIVQAFHEGLDLHRAVCGGPATAASFVEALIAEHRAGPWAELPPPSDQSMIQAVRRHLDPEVVEADESQAVAWSESHPAPAGASASTRDSDDRLAEENSHERSFVLDPDDDAPRLLAQARRTLRRARRLIETAGCGSLQELDAQLAALAGLEAELHRALGEILRVLVANHAFGPRPAVRELPFRSVGHYAKQRLGLSAAQGEKLLRIARGVRRFPALGVAYESGRIGAEAAFLLLRVFGRRRPDEDTVSAWIDRAERSTIKRLRDEVRIVQRDRALRSAGGRPRGEPLTPPSDSEWYNSLRRTPGRTTREVLRLCEAALDSYPRPSRLVLRLPRRLATEFLQLLESFRDAIDLGRRAEAAAANTEANTGRRTETFSVLRGASTGLGSGLMLLLLDYCKTWDLPRHNTRKTAAEATYERDGYRCTAPGCTSRAQLEEHHIRYRSRNGGEEPANRTTLCRFHHQRGQHGGLTRVTGSAPLNLQFRLGRQDVATDYRNELR